MSTSRPPPPEWTVNLFRQPFQWLGNWAVASQQRARRNAMIASTALTQRRAELMEVEDYLAGLKARTRVATVAVEPAAAANG